VNSLPIVWDYKVPPASSRLIVERESYELLVAAFAEERIEPSLISEIILVSGYLEKEPNLVAFLATRETCTVTSQDPLVDVVAHLCSALRNYSRPHIELRAMWDAQKLQARDLTALEPILKLLLDFYAEVESAYLACAVVDVAIAQSRRPPWWGSKPTVVSKMERWRRTLTLEIGLGRSVEVLLDKVNSMLSVLRYLEKNAARKTTDVFVAASAFCYSCAEIQHRRGFPGISLMMLNRAIEFILTAVSLDAGVAALGADGIILSSNDLLGVSSLIRGLVDAGKVSRSLLSGHTFNAINASRNQLGYTHGLAQVSSADVAVALAAVGKEIRNLDPTLGWWSKVKDVRPDMADSAALVASALDYDRLVEHVDATRLRRDMDKHAAE
jgi:hypothetical protein